MPVSYTYAQLQSQIAFELGQRTDLLSIPSGSGLALNPIAQAIQNAIAKWEREHFYFNEIEAINTVSTVVGQEFYTSANWAFIAAQIHIDKIWVLISNNRYSLNPRTEQYISDTSLNPSVQGQPIDYAYYAETIRLYPIPDGVYQITVEGTQKFSSLANSSDSNSWTTDAADLIKAEAKLDILTNILKQPELALTQKNLIYGDPMNMQEQGFIHALRSEGVQRPAKLKNRANYF
jgi:hypothetical protein